MSIIYHEFLILQKLKRVDFSFNPHYEPEFKWFDNTLLEAVQSDEEHAHNFFRLLSLCHTVMPEYKDGRYRIDLLVRLSLEENILKTDLPTFIFGHFALDWNIKLKARMNPHWFQLHAILVLYSNIGRLIQ